MKASELHGLRENCAGSSSKRKMSWSHAFHRLPLKTGPAILAQTTPTPRVTVLTVSCKPGEEVNGRYKPDGYNVGVNVGALLDKQ